MRNSHQNDRLLCNRLSLSMMSSLSWLHQDSGRYWSPETSLTTWIWISRGSSQQPQNSCTQCNGCVVLPLLRVNLLTLRSTSNMLRANEHYHCPIDQYLMQTIVTVKQFLCMQTAVWPSLQRGHEKRLPTSVFTKGQHSTS